MTWRQRLAFNFAALAIGALAPTFAMAQGADDGVEENVVAEDTPSVVDGADDELPDGIDRGPAANKKNQKKPTKVTNHPARSKSPSTAGPDSQEGWVIRKTKDGYVKVPRSQTFVFSGSEVSGAANRPSQTILGQRPVYRQTTLIPERATFRREFYQDAGTTAASGGNN